MWIVKNDVGLWVASIDIVSFKSSSIDNLFCVDYNHDNTWYSIIMLPLSWVSLKGIMSKLSNFEFFPSKCVFLIDHVASIRIGLTYELHQLVFFPLKHVN